MTEVYFSSDNWAGGHPLILDAIVEANHGFAPPYGQDDWTGELDATFSEVFEHECFVFPVISGTAANALAISAITPPFGEVYCHAAAHIITAEAGAIEFYSGGARLVTVPGDNGKVDAESFACTMSDRMPRGLHAMMPATLSLTQPTEMGTLYDLSALVELTQIAHKYGVLVHMDGARIANAVAATKVTPADMTWRNGVDVVSFGGIKNGTLGAEAVVTFDLEIAKRLQILCKRSGHLSSKQRFLAAQLVRLVKNDLWLSNARIANSNAASIAAGLKKIPGIDLLAPVDTNHIFCRMTAEHSSRLLENEMSVRPWPALGPNCFRLVFSFADEKLTLDRFLMALSG